MGYIVDNRAEVIKLQPFRFEKMASDPAGALTATLVALNALNQFQVAPSLIKLHVKRFRLYEAATSVIGCGVPFSDMEIRL